MRKLLSQFARFGVVGAVGLVVDLGIFNLLLFTVLKQETIHEGPILAKVISTTVAIICNWIGNRLWTFREHRGAQLWREGVEFAIVSLGGLVIGVSCLWISHYVLGFTHPLADNISSNVIGLGLGTAFRFALYRYWVFAPHRGDRAPALFPTAEVPDPTTSANVHDVAGGDRDDAVGSGAHFEPSRRVKARRPPLEHPADG